MNFISRIFRLIGTGFTNFQYYDSMNSALKRLNNEYTMLHYPLYVNDTDSFIQAQKNLTDYCVSLLHSLKNKEVLEIGCGNGVQALYINSNYGPLNITGIDLSASNIRIANLEREKSEMTNVRFLVDDAQNLAKIESDSIDVIINIESAFHYPDKAAFIREVARVLKPGGQYLIADILSTRRKREGIMKLWGKPMIHHFWNKKRYDEAFQKSDLETQYNEDITHHIKKGWSIYRNWIPAITRKDFFQDIAYRIFYVINVRINIYFLHRRQQYHVYVGHKPFRGLYRQ